MTPSIEELHALATTFRTAILACPPESLLPTLRDFPLGACGDASILLGEFLHERGAGEWDYLAGERNGDQHSHAWVEQNGLIIDITADQFADVEEPVIITRDREWHAQFNIDPVLCRTARIAVYDPGTTRLLTDTYDQIRSGVACKISHEAWH